MTGIRHQISTISVLLGLLGRIFALPKRAAKTTSKKHRKKCENQGFWPPKTLPKSIQNASENDVPTNMGFFSDFGSKKPLSRERRPLIFAGRAIVLLAFHTIQCFAFCMHFRSKKSTENPSKTMPEPFKNRCRKRIDFQHRFFQVLASIWEGRGLPTWSHVGHFGFKKLRGLPI